jgi:hypothetical protein
MLGWRAKLLLLGIVYLCGFATAVYCLAPPANVSRETLAARQANLASAPSERVLEGLGVVLHKVRVLGEDLVDRVTVLIQARNHPSTSPDPGRPSKP